MIWPILEELHECDDNLIIGRTRCKGASPSHAFILLIGRIESEVWAPRFPKVARP